MSKQSGFSVIEGLVIIVIVGIIGFGGWYVWSQNQDDEPAQQETVQQEAATDQAQQVEVTVALYSKPFDDGFGLNQQETGKDLVDDRDITVVLTAPFPSLDSYKEAEIIESRTTETGKVIFDVEPGKYGLYVERNGQQLLYNDLTLENPSNDVPRNEQGPWYVTVDPSNIEIDFLISIAL